VVGVDGISIQFLKMIFKFVAEPITHLVNLSIGQRKFAISWKRSIVLSIPMKNVVLSLGDLRPISFLSVMSKIVEKVIFRLFTIYLNTRGFFDQKQSGFRTGHSCTIALLEITEDVRNAAEVGMMTSIIESI
jgi:uncharacterized protein involved in cysteine biosynthesis